MKSALLSYSKQYFDPAKEIFSTSSTGIIIRSLYSTLVRAGYSVDYINCTEADIFGLKQYDLFIGQPTNWLNAARRSKAKIKILFMPTSHPFKRNILLRQEAYKRKVPIDEDIAEGPKVWKSFEEADLILQIGNQYAIKALIRFGVDPNKIIHIHYGMNHISYINNKQNINSYLHIATSLGLRKGFPEVLDIFSKNNNAKIRLTFMGNIANDSWKKILNNYLSENQNWKYIPWVNSDLDLYKEIIREHSWIIFPSIEDVEPGVLQDAMTIGLVPLVTSQGSGVDFSLSDNFDLSVDEQYKLTRKMSKKQFQLLSNKSKHYVGIFHDHSFWEKRLSDIWNSLKDNKINCRPKVSIILIINNKDSFEVKKIDSLLDSIKNYGNYSLIIISYGEFKNKFNKSKSYTHYHIESSNRIEAINLGFTKSNGTYCVIVDENVSIHEEKWLEKMISWIDQHSKVGMLGGMEGITFNSRIEYKIYDNKRFNIKKQMISEVDAVLGSPIIIRKELINKLTGNTTDIFPKNLCEIQISLMIRKLGFSIFYLPLNVVKSGRYNSNSIFKDNYEFIFKKWKLNNILNKVYLNIIKPEWGVYYDPRSVYEKIRDKMFTFFYKNTFYIRRLSVFLQINFFKKLVMPPLFKYKD